MVHPDYRRQKVFTTLFQLAMDNRKDCKSGMLLLSDANSAQGLNFIKKNLAKYHHSEFEMMLNMFRNQLCTIIEVENEYDRAI